MFFIVVACLAILTSCKEKESDRFDLLTGHIWVAVSLLADGVDATGPGGVLEGFVGDVKFNTDGTGYFGSYTGTWNFDVTETKIIISSPSLPASIPTNIVELTSSSLKLQALIPNLQNPTGPAINIEMAFRPK